MSRNTWWKPEKTKVKVVFRLQFHATHIPQTGWNNLFISFIRSGSSKATAKTNKANVRNGTCKWADPIYETTELLQDPKTCQYDEKLYKLVVAKGTSRSSLLGEATINLSDYVDASSPTIVALPLHGSDTGAILHVAVQLLTSKTGFREYEQQVSDGGVPANTDHNGGAISTLGEAAVSHGDKVIPRATFKPEPKEFPSPEVESGFSKGYADSAGDFYGYANTSGSLYAEKHDNSSTRKIDSIKRIICGDLSEVSSSRSPIMETGQSDHRFPMHSTIVNREMAIVHRENSRLQRDLEAANLSIHELRKDIASLQNFADSLSFQAQKLTEQMAVEMSSEKNMAKDVSMLKEEFLRFKHDLDQVRNLKMNIPVPGRKLKDADQCTVLQNSSLGWLKGLQNMEEKIYQLQKKVYRIDDGKNLTSLKSDIEGLYSVLIDLKQETENSILQRGQLPPSREKNSTKTDKVMSVTGLGVELCQPEGVLLSGMLASVTSFLDGSNLMQRRFFKLLREMDELKTERGNLVGKMDQMECYYEALIHDLEKNQKQILGELQNLRDEHSSCIYTVSSTNSQMEAIHQQMDNEALQLAEERNILDVVNKELQRKAATSELALKRVSTNYSVAVNQLQKDLEVLSSQIHSMYESNETNETQGSNVDQSMESQSRNVVLKNHQDIKSLVASQEDMYRKTQEELSEMYLAHVNLDVLSVILHQALLEAALVSGTKIHELVELLELSCKSNQSLTLKLQNISDEVGILNKEKAISVSQSNDLDAKSKSVSDENVVLSERIVELESLMVEYRNYKSKYESCDVEKAKLMNELEQVVSDKHHLSHEALLLREQVMTMKIKVRESEQLQNLVDYIQERLENLLVIGNEQVNGLLPHNKKEKSTGCEKFMSNFKRLEECLQNLNYKLIQLTEDNTNILNERDVALVFFAHAEGEVQALKHKFEQDVLDMVRKLNASSSLVGKLQIDLETVSNRLTVSSEAEENCIQMTKDVLSDFTKMEAALHELTMENKDHVDRILTFGSSIDEFEDTKLTVEELKQGNISLIELLQSNIYESDMFTKELDNLKIIVESLKDETSLLKGVRDQLDTQILDLNNQLKDRDDKLAQLHQQETELHHLKQQLSDVESVKISLQHQLSCVNAQLKKALEESYTYSEYQLLEMHVVQTVVVKQHEFHVEELLRKLEYYKNLEEADKKTLDLASRLSNCLAGKENYAAENARLLSNLQSLESNLEYNVAWSRALKHSNSSMAAELEMFMDRCELLEARCVDDENNKFEIKKLDCLLKNSQTEIEDLIFSKEELEIRFLVLQTTIDEIRTQMFSQGECIEELAMLQKQCNELTCKLSEQILKTEEFKSLSDDLKEKCEKREVEGSSFASQESLRIVFLKDYYETKLQEIHHQLSISEKHSEEMLLKLQDALDDLENRKKCEALQLKRNEELMLKIAELESELQMALSENREKFVAYEQLKAEFDCSVMSLECCKEEINMLSVSLQECTDCKCELAEEVELMREQLENFKASMTNSQNRSPEVENLGENSVLSTSCCSGEALEERDSINYSNDQPNHLAYIENLKLDKEGRDAINPQAAQEASVTKAAEEQSGLRTSENDAMQNLNPLKDQLKPQFLLSVIERLQKELEQMRSENTLILRDENPDELVDEESQRNRVHLKKVSEEIEDKSSLYNDSSRSRNSVDIGLSLELDLAEALRVKKSIIKVQSNEAATSQSFRTTNELIKDIHEMKESYDAIKTELKEMHGRYSQLSLDYAEVEGERQKLKLMLKNVRSTKKLLSRSLTSSLVELSS